jgi:hypothetical protein
MLEEHGTFCDGRQACARDRNGALARPEEDIFRRLIAPVCTADLPDNASEFSKGTKLEVTEHWSSESLGGIQILEPAKPW